MTIRVGIVPVNSGGYLKEDLLRDVARAAEDAGFESLWTFEHVIIPEQYESVYPYNPSGKIAVSEAPWCICQRKGVANGGAAEIENVFQRQLKSQHPPLNREPFHTSYPPHRKVATPLRDQHAFISSEVERGRSLRVPAMLGTSRGEAEIHEVHHRARRDVSQSHTRPCPQEVRQGHV